MDILDIISLLECKRSSRLQYKFSRLLNSWRTDVFKFRP